MKVIKISSDWMCVNIPKLTHNLILDSDYEKNHKPFV